MDRVLDGELEQIVRWSIDHETGNPCNESILLRDGCTLHSDHFPAYREFDPVSGRVLLEQWRNFGVADRLAVDKPCETRWSFDSETIVGEIYMKMGKCHRENHRPAKIWYSPDTGNVIREEFWIDNQLHRDNNLPAVIEFDETDGNAIRCEYFVRGKRIDQLKPSP